MKKTAKYVKGNSNLGKVSFVYTNHSSSNEYSSRRKNVHSKWILKSLGKSLVSIEGNENSQNTVSRIPTASKHSTKDDFVNRFLLRDVFKLLDVEQGMDSIIFGSIIAIHEDEVRKVNVVRLSDDPDIIDSLIVSATLSKPEDEATSTKLLSITPLLFFSFEDLESQTDENTTPANAFKIIATSPHEKAQNLKRASVEDPSSECSKTKRKLVDVQVVENSGSEFSKTKCKILQVKIDKGE
uniref:Nucleic acid-binding, OB-fold protein n=1 Tax=Tanacetum cinerariifolium TaxID=118510 RepID=A0A699HRK4_TANCI|nr:nucleic acid-binding, OB-fold protein [Tanacetum cinerariifolium]